MIAQRIKVHDPQRAAGRGKHTIHTKLIWHRERLAALLGFAIGVMVTAILASAFYSIPNEPPCTYSPPELPIQGCTFEWPAR